MRRMLPAKIVIAASLVPVILWAYEYGPDPGYAGVPNENGDCAGCHLGTRVNGGPGSVGVTFPNGLTYAPGVAQHLKVIISDLTQRAWGFEVTARPASDPKTTAGRFTSTDNNTRLMCSQPNLFIFAGIAFSGSGGETCPSDRPLQYIEHSLTGYNSTRGIRGSASYEFDWLPPASGVGDIVLYVAANAANGDLTSNGDHIYTASYTLAAASAAAPPVITGVGNALTDSLPGIFPGSFVAIKGTNLTKTQLDDWSKSITADGHLPTKLDDVLSVTMGGAPAYIYAVTPGQINVQAPDLAEGRATVVVTTMAGASNAFDSTVHLYGPALVPWPNNQPGATHSDFTFAAKNGTFPGTVTVAAKPGEIISLWGTGFGPAVPIVPAGQEPGAKAGASLAGSLTVTLNGKAIPAIAALSQYAGDYQVNAAIPSDLADGDYPLVIIVNSVSSPAYTLTVQR